MLRMRTALDEAAKKRIYESAIRLLEKHGFLCNHAEILSYLRGAGCKIGPEKQQPRKARQVLFTEEIVAKALKKIPSEVILYPTAPGYRELKLGSGRTYFENSGGDYVRDMRTHKLRPGTVRDVVVTSRLIDACEHMDLNGWAIYWMYDLVHPDDYERYGVHQIDVPLSCLHSGKHSSIVYATAMDTEIRDHIKAWQICAGGEEAFRKRPCGSQYLAAISPFYLGGKVEAEDPSGHADALVVAAKAGAVLQLEPCGLLGATGPVTVAGLVTQSLAEFMGLNVAVQAISPGNPVVLNDYTGTFDMGVGQKQEAWPEALLVHLGLTEMAHYIHVPIDCLCSSASLEADAQQGWENMGDFLAMALAGTDIVCSAGATSVDKVFDPLALLMGNEIAGWVKHVIKGIPVDDVTIPLDLMMERGSAPLGGNFLEAEHTLRLYRETMWRPSKVTNRLGRDAWLDAGEPSLLARASDMADEILATHEPDLTQDRQTALREWIAEILDREGVRKEEAKEILEKTYWDNR